jgi:membrane protease YdiL (CAAX protease family)
MEERPEPEAPGNRVLPPWILRLAAILEVMSVLVGGTILARIVAGRIGLARSRDLINSLPEGAAPDFLRMAWISAVDLLIKYGIMFGLAYAIGRWHRGRRLPQYGLTLNSQRMSLLAGIGVLLYCVSALPPTLLTTAAAYVDLGAGPEHWSILSNEWNLGFWVFMAATSFLLVPFLEELFVRGYFQTRLIEDYGTAGGIVITAFVFGFSHTQYFAASVMSLGMLASIVIGSIISGYVFYRTKSLVPVIVAHMIVNIPMIPVVERVALAAMILMILIYHRAIAVWARDLFTELRRMESVPGVLVALLVFGLLLVVVLISPYVALGLVAAGALIAIIIEAKDRASVSRVARA